MQENKRTLQAEITEYRAALHDEKDVVIELELKLKQAETVVKDYELREQKEKLKVAFKLY